MSTMQRIAGLTVVFGVVFPVAGMASDCASGLSVDSSVTSIIQCLQEQEAEIARLAAIQPVKGDTGAKGDPGERGEPGKAADLPVGAVLILDSATGCPSGWKDMGTNWRGRSVVAAVRNANDIYAFGRTGGAEKHTLTGAEIPSHHHNLSLNTKSYKFDQFGSKFIRFNVTTGGKTAAGQSKDETAKPHNNMPPYIALYFCKKER